MSQEAWLVTGATGFVGARLVRLLEDRGHEVFAWTRETGDLSDASLVANRIGAMSPGYIVHLAAAKAVVNEGDWQVPARETAMLSNLAYSAPAGCRIVHAGSVSEYGRSGRLGEHDQRRPRSLYGFAKAIASDLAVSLRAQEIADIRVARLFGIYGPGEAPTRLVPQLVAKLANGLPVALGNRDQVRDFSYIDDICECLIALAQAEAAPPVLNIGTGAGVSVGNVSDQVAAMLGADPTLLRFGTLPTRAIDEDLLVADVTLARKFLCPPQPHWLGPSQVTRAYVNHQLAALDADQG